MNLMNIVRLLFLAIETPLLIVLIVYLIKIERASNEREQTKDT